MDLLPGASSVAIAIVVVAAVLVVISNLLLLNYFGDRRTVHWYVVLATFLGWFVSFSTIFLLPMDVSSVSEALAKR
jgi:hypothetical protein